MRIVSPTLTRITGPGTLPVPGVVAKVQTFWTKPSATVISFSSMIRSMSCTVPLSSAGAVASRSS